MWKLFWPAGLLISLNRYNRATSLLKLVACNCGDSKGKPRKCFEDFDKVQVGFGVVCSTLGSVINAPPSELKFSENSVSVNDGCVGVNVYKVLASQFEVDIDNGGNLAYAGMSSRGLSSARRGVSQPNQPQAVTRKSERNMKLLLIMGTKWLDKLLEMVWRLK